MATTAEQLSSTALEAMRNAEDAARGARAAAETSAALALREQKLKDLEARAAADASQVRGWPAWNCVECFGGSLTSGHLNPLFCLARCALGLPGSGPPHPVQAHQPFSPTSLPRLAGGICAVRMPGRGALPSYPGTSTPLSACRYASSPPGSDALRPRPGAPTPTHTHTHAHALPLSWRRCGSSKGRASAPRRHWPMPQRGIGRRSRN